MSAGPITKRAWLITAAVDRITDDELARAMKRPANREKLIETLLAMGELCDDATAAIGILKSARTRLEGVLGTGSIRA